MRTFIFASILGLIVVLSIQWYQAEWTQPPPPEE